MPTLHSEFHWLRRRLNTGWCPPVVGGRAHVGGAHRLRYRWSRECGCQFPVLPLRALSVWTPDIDLPDLFRIPFPPYLRGPGG